MHSLVNIISPIWLYGREREWEQCQRVTELAQCGRGNLGRLKLSLDVLAFGCSVLSYLLP